VLYKLLDQGFVSDKKVLVGKRMQRVYYHLEPSGEVRLNELIQEYDDVTQGVFQIIKGEETNGQD
jgi:PadR family transcriptional regulator PadR